MYQHILITLNYSSSDARVIAKGVQLQQRYQAKLSLVHALDNIAMPDTAYGTRITLDQVTDYPELEREKQRLLLTADNLQLPHQDCWLVWGSPQQEILRVAQRLQVDLIIVGAHTQHGLAILAGSTANSVLHHAPCDLLAVHLPS